MSRHTKLSLGVFGIAAVMLFGVIFTTCCMSKPTLAYTATESSILKKALLQGLRTCYNNDNMEPTIKATEYFSPASLVKTTGLLNNYKGSVLIPNGVGHEADKSTVNCAELFEGVKSGFITIKTVMPGLISLFNKPAKPELTKLGYKLTDAGDANTSQQRCAYYTYGYPENGVNNTHGETNHLCFKVDSDGIIDVDDYLTITGNGNAVNGPIGLSASAGVAYGYATITIYLGNTGGTHFNSFDIHTGEPWTSVEQKFQDNMPKDYYVSSWDPPYTRYELSNVKLNTPAPESGSGANYAEFSKQSSGAIDALRYFLDDDRATFNSNAVSFNSLELYTLYTSYYNQVVNDDQYKNVVYRAADSDCTPENKYTYSVYTGTLWCEVFGVENVSKKFNGINTSGDGYWNSMRKDMSFAEIVAAFKTMNYDVIKAEGGTVGGFNGSTINNGSSDSGNNDVNGGSTSDSDGGEISVCFAASGALGWILCPVLDGLSTALNGLYQAVIEPFLEIDARQLFSMNSGSTGVYDGWKIFRDLANTLFAIAFVIVILSQVTGVGLSNYNVKKILPRLIMVVVLVNISFILCQLAVDISNILGNTLEAEFSRLADSVSPANPYTLDGITGLIKTSLFSAGTTAITIGAVAGVAVAAWLTWDIWIFPVLLALICCLIAVVFFFILLGIRQAGVIILAAIAPIAIVCYALPNTKSFFDKWYKMFGALLMVYPICGVLMGGGKFASALLVSAGSSTGKGFVFMLVAMLLSVIPFFLIPTILKSSMAAMGNLGMKISQMGSRLGSGISRGVRNSEFGRDIQRQRQMDYNLKSANRLLRRQQRTGRLSDGQQRRLHRHASAYKRARFEDIRAGGDRYDDLPIPGSDAERLMKQEVSDKQHASDVANMASIYAAGGEGIGYNSSNIRADDIDDQATELEAQYGRLAEQIDAGEDTKETETRIEALQDLLSKTDPGRAKVQDAVAGFAASDEVGVQTKGTALSKIAGHLRRKHGDLYKSKNRGFHSMIEDFARGDFSHAFDGQNHSQFHWNETPAADGSTRRSYFRSDYYDQNKVSGYDEQGLAGADDGALNRLRDGVASGVISGRNLQSLSRIANKAISIANFKITDSKQRQRTNAGSPGEKHKQEPHELRQGANPDCGFSICEGLL